MKSSEHLKLSRYLREVAETTGASVDVMKVTISEWRREDPAWDRKISRLLTAKNQGWYTKHGAARPTPFELPEGVEEDSWREVLVQEAARLGSMKAACDYLGIPLAAVNRSLDPSSKRFDPLLQNLVTQLHEGFVGDLEATFAEGLDLARKAGDHKALISGSLKALEMVGKQRWGRSVTVHGKVDHRHALQEQKVGQMEDKIGQRLLGGDFSASDVVEGEVLDEQ